MAFPDTEEIVGIIELPDDEFFMFVDGQGERSRMMIRTSDIKSVDFPQGDDLVLTIHTWHDDYTFKGKDASAIEEFLLGRKSYGGN